MTIGLVTDSVSDDAIVRLVIVPENVSLSESDSAQFVAFGRTRKGAVVPIGVTWSAEGGEIDSTGRFHAGALAGHYRIVSRVMGGTLADTAHVAIEEADEPPPPARRPGTVADLAVPAVTENSATLTFTEVDDGQGEPANYDVRYAPAAHIDWSSASSAAQGSCATPLSGGDIGARRTCTVLGLTAGMGYTFQLVAFRGTLNGDAVFGDLSNEAHATATERPNAAPGECATPRTSWIWCDDFEQDRLARYFEYDDRGGDFARAAGVGTAGSFGMRARWAAAGQMGAGSLHLAFGKTPSTYIRPVDDGTAIYRDIYWRLYVRNAPDWIGGGADKLSRAISFATANWAEAMVAHVWSGVEKDRDHLVIDPASGTDVLGTLLTTKYNDWTNMRWMGMLHGVTQLFDASQVGRWHCVEAHAKLNEGALPNGVFELWVNGNLEAQHNALNWVGLFGAYGINALFFENYWNAGAPRPQERYFDNIVVSTERIGCLASSP